MWGMSLKTDPGNFFEDFTVGQVIEHATPRTVTEGDRALYGAMYPTRFAVPSSAEFAAWLRAWPRTRSRSSSASTSPSARPCPDVSLNAVANLGYAECRFHRPVVPGDTLRTRSEVIGLKQNSNGRTGVVYVRSTATNQRGEVAIDWARWVMVHKRDDDAPAPETVVPTLAEAVAPATWWCPPASTCTATTSRAAGEPHRWGDYEVGERIDHVDGVTLTDAEHMMATRLWQNTAKVHFNTEARPDGSRLVYGGHVISLARRPVVQRAGQRPAGRRDQRRRPRGPGLRRRHGHAWSEVLDTAETGRTRRRRAAAAAGGHQGP